MCLQLTKNELVCSSTAQQSPQGEPMQVIPGTAHHPLGSAQHPEAEGHFFQLCEAWELPGRAKWRGYVWGGVELESQPPQA